MNRIVVKQYGAYIGLTDPSPQGRVVVFMLPQLPKSSKQAYTF